STTIGTSTFRLGGADDTDATNENGIHFRVYSPIKTVGLLGDTDLGSVLPNTTASATWYGRLFVKTDATAFNPDNEKQIGLNVNFGEGTIDTPAPVKFTIGAQTHSVSIRGRFGLNDFARDSDVPSASGLLSGFVEYTHHGADTATQFPLIGLIGEEGALGVFKGNVAGVGLVGGFEVSPPVLVTNAPNHETYLEQFGGYINDEILRNTDNVSQISLGEAHALALGDTTPNPRSTYRLGGSHSDENLHTSGQDILSGFALGIHTGDGNASVGILSGTNLGEAVVSADPTAIWAGRLYVNSDSSSADIQYAKLDLQVNFGAGTIETLAPITIVAYAESPEVYKQSLEIKGIFGSHLDAFGLRTGTLGGTVEYTVGHYALDTVFTDIPSLVRASAMAHSRVTARLPLLGLIGKDGAIGVFHGVVAGDAFDNVHVVGGFEVSPRAEIPTTTASFERWARGARECEAIKIRVIPIDFDTECATTKAVIFAHPNDLFLSDEDFSGKTTRRQGFVLGSTGGDGVPGIDLNFGLSPRDAITIKEETLDLGDDVIVNRFGERFTLSDAMGDATDGVVFVSDTIENSMYVGLLSGTDLGAPLTTTTNDIQTIWPGRLAYLINGALTEDGDFTLTVDFANMRISGDVAVAGGFALEGSYDEFGVITGIIKGKQVGTLAGSVSGLIGRQGAVGAFVINTSDPRRVGGFVAAPVAKVTATSYAHFERHHKALTGDRQLHANLTTGGAAAFGVTTATGLSTMVGIGATFTTANPGEFGSTAYKLGGDESSPDGFALLNGVGGTDKRLRAGILFETDLGPVVSAAVNGLWTGTAYLTTGIAALEFALNLNVDFAAGTINTVADGKNGAETLQIAGRFGALHSLPPGILGGTAISKSYTLPLIGLIGVEGVVGVFAGTDTSNSPNISFAGGFTARPFALTPAGIAAATPPTLVDAISGVLPNHPTAITTHDNGGFLTLSSSFSESNLPEFPPTPSDTLDPYVLVPDSFVMIKNDIEFDGGFAYYSIRDGASDSRRLHYAGILADTNLGEPVASSDPTAKWTGVFSDYNSSDPTDKSNFVDFHVNFGRGELQFHNGLSGASSGGGGTLTRDGNTYTLNARFGNGFADANNNIITTGQLGGQVLRDSPLGNGQVAAISGLIGAKGAVGAFVNPKSLSFFAGGFWAVETIGPAPDGDAGAVNFGDWSDGFGREHTLPSRLNAGKSQFLEGKATVTNGIGLDETGVSVSKRFALTFDNDSASYKGSPLGGNGTAADGVSGILGGNGNRYVGLLSGTNLGAPIRSTLHVGMWRGQFVGYGRRGTFGYNRTSDNVVLAVTYDTAKRNGTIKIVNPSCRTASKSCINSPHFGSRYYEMVGGKYNDRGVISGEIRYYYTSNSRQGYVPAHLTGLIGRDGAVGGFISGRGTIDSITNNRTAINPATGNDWSNDNLSGGHSFGGFVATSHTILESSVPDSFVPNYAHFEYYYTNFGQGGRRLPTFAVESGTGARIAFLAGTETGLDDTGISVPTTTIYRLSKAETGGNGFAFVNGTVGGNGRYRVGLLSSTTLGAAFATAPMVTEWAGSVRVSTVADPDIILSADGTFTLNFDDGTITSPDIAIGTASDTIRIAGTFRFGTNINKSLGAGILGGSAFFNTTELPLIGLIGEAGALGVFTDGTQFGGFEAGPPPPPPTGPRSAPWWVENALDSNGTGTTNRAGIKADEDADATDLGQNFATADADGVNLGDTVPTLAYATRMSGATHNGFGVARAQNRSYVDILSTTDLGEPMPFMS
ncbi:MAG: hypothetical protein K0U66_07150, partial [Gammaproteobacteria bacterium]|nr:hypothetical protein [Gammaproteobacteria bacterium]